MVSALSEPYIKLARSKGASEFRIVTRHALRNAAAPALTVAGDLTVGLVNGAVVVETIFGWPGIGKLMIDSILQRDFAVLQAAVLITAVTIFALNIFIDLGYALLDARVRPVVKASDGEPYVQPCHRTQFRPPGLRPATPCAIAEARRARARRQGGRKKLSLFRLLLKDQFADVGAVILLIFVGLTAALRPVLMGDLATKQNLLFANNARRSRSTPAGSTSSAATPWAAACSPDWSSPARTTLLGRRAGGGGGAGDRLALGRVGRVPPGLAGKRLHAHRRHHHELPVAAAGGRRALRVQPQRRRTSC